MHRDSARRARAGTAFTGASAQPTRHKARGVLVRAGVRVLSWLLGSADGHTVATMAHRELGLLVRSREWHQLIGRWTSLSLCLLLVPLLLRPWLEGWRVLSGAHWFMLVGFSLQIAFFLFMAQWTMRRLRRHIYTSRLEELLLTRCSPADLAVGQAIAFAVTTLWFTAASAPVVLLVGAFCESGVWGGILLLSTLPPIGGLGVWFGMGWGLAMSLRRMAAVVPLTKWWLLGPFIPIWIGWSLLGFFTLAWAMLSLIPGGNQALGTVIAGLKWLLLAVLPHVNPLLLVPAAAGAADVLWFTNWLVLALISLFMLRMSMDPVQIALGELEERGPQRKNEEAWIHHNRHVFQHYGERGRPTPPYRDTGDPIAAFDLALGHRLFLHPFLWTVMLLAYLFLVGWSLLVPHLGLATAAAAVFVPATASLVLMSGGVAVSFGWERDQRRWQALAALPISDFWMAFGKIKGVVRPMLWLNLMAGATAMLLGWRGAIPMETARWMALHVMLFPLTLACIAATLALSTPTVAEALYRWALLGALFSAAAALPPPVGGLEGAALPFSPPLLVLMLVAHGPLPELIRGAWIALGLEVVGIAGSLFILSHFLRRWTSGERA
jgi:hypothetical protein